MYFLYFIDLRILLHYSLFQETDIIRLEVFDYEEYYSVIPYGFYHICLTVRHRQ